MKSIIKIVSFIGLALTIIPSIMVFSGSIDLDSCKTLMIIGTFIWFATAPSYMNKTE
jgi:hypothetical protein